MRILFIFILLSAGLFAKEPDRKYFREEAKRLGSISIDQANSFLKEGVSQELILPNKDRGKTFSPSKKDVLEGKVPDNPIFDFAQENARSEQYVSENENMLSDHSRTGNFSEEIIEICNESTDAVMFPVTRTLSYGVEKVYETVSFQRCLGHEESKKVSKHKGKKEAEKERQKFRDDPEIKFFEVTSEERGSPHRHHDMIYKKWEHVEDCSTCDHKETVVEHKETGEWRIGTEKWIYGDPRLENIAIDPNSSLISNKCLDDEDRVIHGTRFSRCWVEKQIFVYTPPKVSGCDYLKDRLCRLEKSTCLVQGPFGCNLWERIFHCFNYPGQKESYQIDNLGMGLDDGPIFEQNQEPNNKLSDVIAKLEIFKEIDKNLKNAQIDIKDFKFFSGKNLRCYVHFMGSAAYDCCKDMGGLANDALVSKCDQEEVALYDLKNRGQCRYIGKKDNTVAGINVSQKHVYCCFSSKLARIFVEQAKEQLNLDWGTVHHPICKGLTHEKIQQVNFDNLNLSEAFEEYSEDYKERLDRLRQKITEGLKSGC